MTAMLSTRASALLAKLSMLSLLCAASVCPAQEGPCPRCGAADCAYTLGINWAGPEFSNALPGVEGVNYGWPTAESLDYWKEKGIRLIRLPFKWERLQPELKTDFDPKYLAGLERSVALMRERGMKVILDVHNYAVYRQKPIGTGEVTVDAFADLWRRLAEKFKDETAIWGYGLMNEPTGKCDWPAAAQAAIDAIRAVDAKTMILVANDYAGWSATRANQREKDHLAEWAEKGMRIPDPAKLRDPSSNLRFELHTYFDHDASGTYKKTYEEEITRRDGPEVRVGPNTGIDRIRPFVEWLKKHKVKGFIGEYSAPANPGVDPRWMETLEKTLAFMQENCLPSTYWAGGTCWSLGHGSVIEQNGWPKSMTGDERKQDRPQVAVLQKHR